MQDVLSLILVPWVWWMNEDRPVDLFAASYRRWGVMVTVQWKRVDGFFVFVFFRSALVETLNSSWVSTLKQELTSQIWILCSYTLSMWAPPPSESCDFAIDHVILSPESCDFMIDRIIWVLPPSCDFVIDHIIWAGPTPELCDMIKYLRYCGLCSQRVNWLAMETRQVVKGNHTRKTAAFVRACAAYCFITIPSLENILSRLSLYLISGRVAIANGALSQGRWTKHYCLCFVSLWLHLMTIFGYLPKEGGGVFLLG